MADLKIFSFNPFGENTIILSGDDGQCVLIDPGCYDEDERNTFYGHIGRNALKPAAILLTHGHPDHIFGAADAQRRFACPVYMNPEDRKLLEYDSEICGRLGLRQPDISFETTDAVQNIPIAAAGFNFAVIETPGHTDGGVCYYEKEQKLLFTGDTLFAGTIGRTDLKYGNYDSLIVSIMDKLMGLPGDIDVLPGHGPCTTIADERTGNPMLEPFNEPEEYTGQEDGR